MKAGGAVLGSVLADEPAQGGGGPPRLRHVAIIMDGNGRWARQRSLPRSAGHHRGIEALRCTVRRALEVGIRYLTVFGFSAENWSRPSSEVNYLFSLLRQFIRDDVERLDKADVRIRIIGERHGLPQDIIELIDKVERLTADNGAMDLIVALNYGARQEIVEAARRVAEAVAAGEIAAEDVDQSLFAAYLHTGDIPDPDLLIRTSGEMRVSNFLLWQCAYAELVFAPEYWPDFNAASFDRAIAEYHGRDRRFGGLRDAV